MENEDLETTWRRLAPSPFHEPTNWSARRISALAAAFPDMTSYLEVGLDEGFTFELVGLPHRVGVDPRPRFDVDHLPAQVTVHRTTSDAYFANLASESYFDIVFLDGLHTYQQTYQDLINALHHCPWGAILIDDVVPSDDVSAIPVLEESYAERGRRGLPGGPWHGDVFRLMLCIADHHPELEYVTITDNGNPQALVWKTRFDSDTRPVDDLTLATYMNRSYQDVFGAGVPSSFNPMPEDQALARTVIGLRKLRSQRRPFLRRVATRLSRGVKKIGQSFIRAAEQQESQNI